MHVVLALIKSDIDNALASVPQHRGDDKSEDYERENKLKEELMNEVKGLKKEHESLLNALTDF